MFPELVQRIFGKLGFVGYAAIRNEAGNPKQFVDCDDRISAEASGRNTTSSLRVVEEITFVDDWVAILLMSPNKVW